ENWPANTDWQEAVFQQGILNYNNLSVSGASENNKIYMGVGYTVDQGVIKHEQLEKITLNINVHLNITENFRVGISFSGYRSELPMPNNLMDAGVASALRAAPIAPTFN